MPKKDNDLAPPTMIFSPRSDAGSAELCADFSAELTQAAELLKIAEQCLFNNMQAESKGFKELTGNTKTFSHEVFEKRGENSKFAAQLDKLNDDEFMLAISVIYNPILLELMRIYIKTPANTTQHYFIAKRLNKILGNT